MKTKRIIFIVVTLVVILISLTSFGIKMSYPSTIRTIGDSYLDPESRKNQSIGICDAVPDQDFVGLPFTTVITQSGCAVNMDGRTEYLFYPFSMLANAALVIGLSAIIYKITGIKRRTE